MTVDAPPLFTRTCVDGRDDTDTAKSLPIFYPKGHLTQTNSRGEPMPPPPADSRFIVMDDGNASPHMIRSTMYAIPTDRNVLRKAVGDKTDIMGLICTPLALPSQDDAPYQPLEPPVDENGNDVVNRDTIEAYLPPSKSIQNIGYVPVDFTTNREVIPRCGRCHAYVNPFFSLSNCNFCGGYNRNVGTHQHQQGTVEYPVTGPYVTRDRPVEPHWIFCLDLTAPLILDYVDLVLETIWPAYYESIVHPCVEHLKANGRKMVATPRVGMAFCSSTGIYIPQKEDCGNSCTGFVVMPDVKDEAFAPLPLSEWSWSLSEEYDVMMDTWKNQIRSELLPQLVEMARADGGYSRSVGGAALGFLADTLQETGGRGVFWTWRRPNFGIGALADREQGIGIKTSSSDSITSSKGPSLYMPLQDSMKNSVVENNSSLKVPAGYYTALGTKCAKAKVALDVMLHTNPNVPQSFLDIATLTRLCEATSGRLSWVNKLAYESTDAWKQSIKQEVMRPVRSGGWDAIFKVRCSQGLSIKSIFSSAGKLSSASSFSDSLTNQEDELELSVVTPETVVGVTLEHRVGGLKKADLAFVQTALLYTNPWTGDRRIRISTLALKASSQPGHILPSVDFGALAALQLRTCLPHSNYDLSSISLDFMDDSSGRNPSSPDQRGDKLLFTAKMSMMSTLVNVLAANRKVEFEYRRRMPSIGELCIPDSLKLWPLFVMAAQKSPLLRPSLPRRGTGTASMVPSPRGDERAHYFYSARRATPSTVLLLVHPQLYDLGSSLERPDIYEWKNLQDPGVTSLDPMGSLKSSPVVDLPSPLPATVSNLAQDGIYLLDTGFVMYVLIERDAEDSHPDFETKVENAVTQLQLWSQIGRESKCLRPTASVPVVHIYQRSDPVQYQALLKWMVLDATSHDRDFGTFCAELSKKVVITSEGK
ncbi:MAG: hypothetical protein SGILL_006315 [Bacillariaceae sp.]